jgi:hypothetical protein
MESESEGPGKGRTRPCSHRCEWMRQTPRATLRAHNHWQDSELRQQPLNGIENDMPTRTIRRTARAQSGRRRPKIELGAKDGGYFGEA